MPLTQLSRTVSGNYRGSNALARNKENGANAKLAAAALIRGAAATRRRRAHPPSGSSRARAVPNEDKLEQSALRRVVRQSRKASATRSARTTTFTVPAPTTAKKPDAPMCYNLPRYLPRYVIPPVNPEAMAAIDEVLRDIPMQFIHDDILANLAPALRRGLAALVPNASTVGRQQSLPKSITMGIRSDIDGEQLRLPTHILAVTAPKSEIYQFYPFHDVLLAANCSYLPHLHAAETPLEVKVDENEKMSITLPVVEFQLTNPNQFHLIYTFLYQHNVPRFLASLLPPTPTNVVHYIAESTGMDRTAELKADAWYSRKHVEKAASVSTEDDDEYDESDSETEFDGMDLDEEMSEATNTDDEDDVASFASSFTTAPPSVADSVSTPKAVRVSRQTPEQKQRAEELMNLAEFYAKTYTLPRLLAQVKIIQGVWQNLILLGVKDVTMWRAMDYAWSAMMKSLEVVEQGRKQASA